MSGDDGNKTVFKPSPLQALKQGGAAPPPKTIPGRPAKAAPAATAPPKPAPSASPVTRGAEDGTIRSGASSRPVEAAQPAPLSAAAPATKAAASRPRRAKKAQRSGAFWLGLAMAAALAVIIVYLLINYSGLVG